MQAKALFKEYTATMMNHNATKRTHPTQHGLMRHVTAPVEWDGTERRESEDRRTFRMSTLQRCLLSPRRFNGRRSGDRRFPVLDRFDSGLAFLAIGLMMLSILDSIFTLTIISNGGTEANPIMDWFLQQSVVAFVGVKMLLTAASALLLVATGNMLVFGRFRARSILAAALGLYCGLIVYELGILSLIG